MKHKPKVAILRGPLLNPFEMQNYEKMRDEFEITAFVPHRTQFDLADVELTKEVLWCPIAGNIPFERDLRKWQDRKSVV